MGFIVSIERFSNFIPNAYLYLFFSASSQVEFLSLASRRLDQPSKMTEINMTEIINDEN